jgi:hypothetical protein
MASNPLKYELEVPDDGRVELRLPLPGGSRVTVFVVPENSDEGQDLVLAAESSIDFWDNPYDDEDWNDA